MKPWSKVTAAAVLLAVAFAPAFGQTNRSGATTTNQSVVTTQTQAATLHASDHVMGRLAATKTLHIVLELKLRNQAQLHTVVQQALHPRQTTRLQPLTTTQFKTRFSPTSEQADTVAEFLRKAGFKNVDISANRMLVSGDATVSVIEDTFDTKLVSVYTNKGRLAHANKRAPHIPAALKGTVLAVLGLQNVHVFHPMNVSLGSTNGLHTNALTGHNPTEFDEIYAAGGAPTAAGVTVGIISAGNMSATLNDLSSFTSQNGLPSVNTQVIHVNGTASGANGTGEWDLDSQDIVGMAGGQVGKITFYTIPNLSNANLVADVNRIVSDNTARIINVSLGECETAAQNDGTAASMDQAFQQAIAQGQTFSVSSGDDGADECSNGGTTPSWPASSQYVVAVGGTTLNTSGSNWNGETVWDGTGGSPSTFEPMPDWQQGVGQNAGHSTRGVPDIAFDADPQTGAIVIVNGRQQQIGGTSLAAPLFAGLWARVIAAKGTDVGFAAPLIYDLPSSVFHDVTSGNNGGESAAAGWDYTTGFGSMKIAAVVNNIGGGGGNPPPGGGNNPPSVQNGSVTTTEGNSVSGTLSASDPDGDALTFNIVSQPANGAVQITDHSTGAFSYSPDNNYTGSDSFTFKANDGQADSNTATESVTVKSASTCPPGFLHFTGSVSQGSDSFEPNGTYYYGDYGVESGRLQGPSGTDFDLYLYKHGWFGWTLVAYSTHYGSSESIDYNGSSGYYYWDIYAYSGSGSYSFCMQRP